MINKLMQELRDRFADRYITIECEFKSYPNLSADQLEVTWSIYVSSEGNKEFGSFDALREYADGLIRARLDSKNQTSVEKSEAHLIPNQKEEI